MMKGWKKKLHRGQKQGNNDAKKSLRLDTDAQQRRSPTSPIDSDVNLTSCLKKSYYDTDGSISYNGKLESDSLASTIDSIATVRTATTCGCSSRRSKKVRFDVVEVREYERAANDNPCCSSGPPIG